MDFIRDWCANHYMTPDERLVDELAKAHVREVMTRASVEFEALLFRDRMLHGAADPE